MLRKASLVLLRVFLSLLLVSPGLLSAQTADTESVPQATILIYHHVSEKTPPSTSISPAKFKEHMVFLKKHHTVISLDKIIQHIKADKPLPTNAVAITFDDGFRNILENAHPVLQEYSFPYTIFVNPAEVGKGSSHLDWQELKKMSEEDVLIASHYWDHRHMLQDVTKENWQEETRNNILKAEKAVIDNIGTSPGFLAYPFGEYNLEMQGILEELDIIGFAQHSGAVAKYSDFAALPRFPAAGIYSNLRTLKVKLNSLALPVLKTSIADPAFYQAPATSFTLDVDTSDFQPHLFACYFKGERIASEWNGNSVAVSSDMPIKPGRSRINCTAPAKSQPGRYYWYSQPFFVATEEGKWLD